MTHKITELYTTWFSVYPIITSKFRTIAIFKSFVKERNDSNETRRYFHDFHCTKLNLCKCNGSWVISLKLNVNFNFEPPAIFVILVFCWSDLIKGCSSFESLSAYKIAWSYVFCNAAIIFSVLNNLFDFTANCFVQQYIIHNPNSVPSQIIIATIIIVITYYGIGSPENYLHIRSHAFVLLQRKNASLKMKIQCFHFERHLFSFTHSCFI
jgi:hypothetical protein